MIMTVTEAREFITTSESDSVLGAKLQALELLIRKFTNNNFQKRNFRTKGAILGQKFYYETGFFQVGDTVQISDSKFNEGLFTIKTINEAFITFDQYVLDEADVLMTKIEYPMDVKLGVVAMLKWELDNRDKVGISSETISRHSVTYFNMDGENSTVGFPKSLTGFLKPYLKARF